MLNCPICKSLEGLPNDPYRYDCSCGFIYVYLSETEELGTEIHAYGHDYRLVLEINASGEIIVCHKENCSDLMITSTVDPVIISLNFEELLMTEIMNHILKK